MFNWLRRLFGPSDEEIEERKRRVRGGLRLLGPGWHSREAIRSVWPTSLARLMHGLALLEEAGEIEVLGEDPRKRRYRLKPES